MDNVLVKVHQGHLRGVIEENVNGMKFMAFRGVPFAKPPVGPLRFKDPEPMPTWGGVRNASKFGNPCAQRNWVTFEIIGSDDCLHLNVYTTILQPTSPKSVMVWIHGGSFISGSADDYFFGPDYLIEKDIVLVTINYRVGILGFLNIEDEEAPGNQGLKDQVMALKWIQQNISQFGGDPNNVTIFGHSAGAASVHYLTISPLAQGLFHKAILQSGIASHPWATSPTPNQKPIQILGSLLHEDISDKIEFVNYLRTIAAHHLVKMEVQILQHLDHIMNTYPFIPSVDLKAKTPFLTIPIEEAVKVGIKVPCIIGYLSHEGLVYVGAVKNKLCDQRNPSNMLLHPYTSRFFKQYDLTAADVKHFFFGEQKISSYSSEKMCDIISAIFFDSNVHNVMEIQSKILDIPTYVYKFEYELETSVTKKILGINMKGTCHGDEIGMLFHSKLGRAQNEESPTPNAIEHRLMQRFLEMWTNFAKTGNPTPQISELLPVTWEPIDGSIDFKCLKIDEGIHMDTVKNINQELIESKRK